MGWVDVGLSKFRLVLSCPVSAAQKISGFCPMRWGGEPTIYGPTCPQLWRMKPTNILQHSFSKLEFGKTRNHKLPGI
jgi:hypothetical protein